MTDTFLSSEDRMSYFVNKGFVSFDDVSSKYKTTDEVRRHLFDIGKIKH